MSSDKTHKLCMVCGKGPGDYLTPDAFIRFCENCAPYVIWFYGNKFPSAEDFEQFRLVSPGAWPFDGSEGEVPEFVEQALARRERCPRLVGKDSAS